MLRRLSTVLLGFALLGAAVAAATAHADGLPLPVEDAGPAGVSAPAADVRYVALRAGRDTIVTRVEQDGGEILRSRFVRGRFAIPVVAADGSPSGLSADGRTLVLVRPRATFPRSKTTFAIFDAERLRLRDTLTLRGDFSFDALSPDGGLLYLIQYISPRDFTRYTVRAYDLRAERLLPDGVVDPREDAAMRGYPITRATSPDGRWAYTLYDGAGKHPFIHALDTTYRTAVCIDLHALSGFKRLYDLRLEVGAEGAVLTVHDRGRALALVDTATFRVSEPRPQARPSPARPAATPPDGRADVPWLLLAAAATAVLVAATGTIAVWRRRRRARLVAVPLTVPATWHAPNGRAPAEEILTGTGR